NSRHRAPGLAAMAQPGVLSEPRVQLSVGLTGTIVKADLSAADLAHLATSVVDGGSIFWWPTE
ncbi:MAG: hypothetical protein JOY71_15610, partial [Acetobacteraceae bacterium]|nr:hypothetical protein [Acetobacteraceae bacterium]